MGFNIKRIVKESINKIKNTQFGIVLQGQGYKRYRCFFMNMIAEKEGNEPRNEKTANHFFRRIIIK